MIADSSASQRNAALLGWYKEHARSLPWRDVSDPYLTLVSESMLQQTQVDRVVPKFIEFVTEWPTVAALASAEPEDVLRVWSGLGYNSRALRLREAAVMVDADGWPTTLAGLQELPGVGPYTAAAIASIAYGQRVPAVDTNLKRVMSRWVGETLEGTGLKAWSQDLVGDPGGDWNQAMMDLGSSVCRPRDPRCSLCPVSQWCTDPTVYEPPPSQSIFKGSNRELRGALVRADLAGTDLHGAGESLGRLEAEVTATIEELRTEGLVK